MKIIDDNLIHEIRIVQGQLCVTTSSDMRIQVHPRIPLSLKNAEKLRDLAAGYVEMFIGEIF